MAAVVEILTVTDDFILICANSNTACNEIALRLVNILPQNQLFRLFAKKFDTDAIPEELKCVSNIHQGELEFPSIRYLYQFRVVISTLMTVGSLVRARGRDQDFNSSHFSRIFIDEAGCVHQPTSMIPIAGLRLQFLCNFFSTPKIH